MIANIKKWRYCFVEWEDTNGEWKLSAIPWYAFVAGILGNIINGNDDFKWAWVPPWKIKITNN